MKRDEKRWKEVVSSTADWRKRETDDVWWFGQTTLRFNQQNWDWTKQTQVLKCQPFQHLSASATKRFFPERCAKCLFLFVLFHSNFLVQALSNGKFWLKESNDARFVMFVFERNCHQNRHPASNTKASFFGRLLTRILHKKRWPANHESKINLKLLTFQS